MAACQQWADTPPPFVFWVSTVQPPLNCCLFSCLQDSFSITHGRKRKKERKGWEKLTQKTQSKLSCAGGSAQLPTLQKMAQSYARNAKCYSRCYLGACLCQNSEKTQTLFFSSEELMMVLDAASNETFHSFYQNHSFCDIPLPKSQC